MGSPLTSSQFVRLLDDRLSDVSENERKDLPKMREKFFSMVTEERAWMEFFEVGDVPDIPTFNGKLSTLEIHPGFHSKIEPKEYAAQLVAERKLIDDKRYAVLDNRAVGLERAADRVKEKLAVNIFANGFSSAFDFMTREEGVALISDSHTTKSGTSTSTGFDNAGTTALSKTSVAATRILMRKFRNDISQRIDVGDNLALIVPDSLADTADEIVGTIKGYDTANHTMNSQFGRYEVIPWLRLDDTDTNNWFMVDMDKMKDNLIWWDRVQTESKNTVDWDTYALKQAVYFRCAAGFRDWRWVHGHQVS